MHYSIYNFFLVIFLCSNCMVAMSDDDVCETWKAGSPICSITFTSDNRMIVTGHGHSRLCFHERNDEGKMEKIEWDCRHIYQEGRAQKDAAIGGKTFICKCKDHILEVYEEDTRHTIVQWNLGPTESHVTKNETTLCSSDSAPVATVIKKDNNLELYDHDGNLLKEVPYGRTAAFSNDENWLAIGCTNGDVVLLRFNFLGIKSAKKR